VNVVSDTSFTRFLVLTVALEKRMDAAAAALWTRRD